MGFLVALGTSCAFLFGLFSVCYSALTQGHPVLMSLEFVVAACRGVTVNLSLVSPLLLLFDPTCDY